MNNPISKDSKPASIAELVAGQVINLIQGGHLKPGDRLPSERKLANQLGIGRPALREAVRALSMLGVLEIQHGGGIFVSALTPETLFGPLHFYVGLDSRNVEAIHEARTVLEGAVLAHIAPSFPADSLARLKRQLVAMEDYFAASKSTGIDVERVQQDAEKFRSIIGEAIRNPILLRALEGLNVLSAATRTQLGNHGGSWEPLMESHKRIVAALESRDPKLAQQAMTAHLQTIRSLLATEIPDKDSLHD